MTAPRLALALVLLLVASTVGVGATAAASGSWSSEAPAALAAANASAPPPMGANISMFMQANAAQTEGSVENGMWVAAYARATNASDRRALVERRVGSLNVSLADLEAERRAVQEAFQNGSMDRVTYQARLSTVVGRLAALSAGIDETSQRGRAVGVNETRLETLRTQARELGGGEVSRIARNLTGGRAPPGHAGVFGDDRPGRSGDGGPGAESEPGEPGPPSDEDRGQSGDQSADDATETPTPTPAS